MSKVFLKYTYWSDRYKSQEDAAAVLKRSNLKQRSSILSSNTQENGKCDTFQKQATSTVLAVAINLTAFEIYSLVQLQQACVITCKDGNSIEMYEEASNKAVYSPWPTLVT